jgi:hypothetical protein
MSNVEMAWQHFEAKLYRKALSSQDRTGTLEVPRLLRDYISTRGLSGVGNSDYLQSLRAARLDQQCVYDVKVRVRYIRLKGPKWRFWSKLHKSRVRHMYQMEIFQMVTTHHEPAKPEMVMLKFG